MLACVCRPVTGSLPKHPASVMPIDRSNSSVVTSEPRIGSLNSALRSKVPGRPSPAELRAMALRQQQQIDSQHQLLAAKEQRLRFLKAQEARGAAAAAEGERLRRLRERVEAQESKLRRLRALRGQVDLQKTYNVTLSNDLDSIRALFSEKEKELSLAVAKVEALTRQLEELRRDRRGPLNLIPGNGNGQPLSSPAARELEKLRRELMYRNQLSLQQDARLHLQREALQQRQAELRSVDQRILELQTRLQRKKASNLVQQQQQASPILNTLINQTHHQQQQQQQQQQHIQQQHINQQISQKQSLQQQQQLQQNAQHHQQQQHHLQQQQQQHNQQHQLQQQNLHQPKKQIPSLNNVNNNQQSNHQSQTLSTTAPATTSSSISSSSNSNVSNQQSNQSHHSGIPLSVRPSNSVYPSQRILTRSNVAAVEPYIHTPQKSTITTSSATLQNNLLSKQSAATLNTNQQNQLIQDLTNLKLNLTNVNANINVNHLSYAESDETKLARQKLGTTTKGNLSSSQHVPSHQLQQQQQQQHSPRDSASDSSNSVTITKSKLPYKSTLKSNSNQISTTTTTTNLSPNSITSSKSHSSNDGIDTENKLNDTSNQIEISNTTVANKNSTQKLTVHSIPLSTANKSVATAVSTASTTTIPTLGGSNTNNSNISSNNSTNNSTRDEKPAVKPKALHQIPSGNLVVPPRKPISSVAPTSITHTSAIPKIVSHSPKVNKVAPNIITSIVSSTDSSNDKSSPRPALPPKPNKSSPPAAPTHTSSTAATSTTTDSTITPTTTATIANNNNNNNNNNNSNFSSNSNIPQPSVINAINKAPISEPNDSTNSTTNFPSSNPDNLPIKAKPLTIRKQPLSEQPRLKSQTSGIKPIQYQTRRIEMPTAFLFPNSNDKIDKGNNNNNNNSNIPSSSLQNQQQPLNPLAIQQQQNQIPSIPSPASASNTSTADETDRSASSSTLNEEGKSPDDIKRRLRHTGTTNENGKVKLTRRVSFDPLALLLDASLEGELELVKKTAMQVTNPSAANDEGITALHNAICAGHIEIVKFLVEFGCDVNAQDSDGWTPLHCAASCNNLAMVKFLVENGACLFAATLSDHETPAEKCEEDEEGFDGCSEYLYSIQEKLGILNSGEVYAVFSYEAQQTDELSFVVNDRLTILRKGDDAEREWWWAKNTNGTEGYVPRNLLGLYPRVPLQTSNFSD
ncbi:apoptosis-stimulating of p53 protein 1 [Condylostylus longicornis]|uniref:apoptosis-stimulating of p53 protein 1 n=1 Tax=Condylostylus longicornis TaxID=2530218 RepID=UPI00244DD388|nr:apoptosis-stimulating of p53 protein 1 [Condylostylus longicornis]